MLMQAWHCAHLITILLFMRRWYSPDFYNFGKVAQPPDALKRRGMRLLFPDEFLQTTGDILITGAYRIFTAY